MKRIAKYCFIAGISLVMGSCGGAKREVEEVPEVPAAPAPPPPSEDFPEAPTAKSDESAANARAVRFTCPDGKFIKWTNYPQGYTVNVDGPEWMKRPDLQLTISLSSDMLRMTLTGSGSSVLDGNYFVSGDERAGGGWSLMFRKVDNETIYGTLYNYGTLGLGRNPPGGRLDEFIHAESCRKASVNVDRAIVFPE